MRSKYILITVVLLTLGFGLGRLSAAPGTLDYPDVPGNTLSYTLEDIYHRLDTGAAGAQSTFTEPAAGPGTGTMHTLNDIMAEAPAADNTDGATETNVPDGKTFWGLTAGQWGTQTGTMPDNGAVTIVPTTTNQTIAAGYHDGLGYVEGDADLVADKIKQGVDMFGVTGSVIEATGDATAGDVLTGKTFSNASAAGINGTMPDNGAVTIVPTTTQQTIALGYHNGAGKVEGDADLVADKIKQGVDMFGVTGIVIEATGDATAANVLTGKTFSNASAAGIAGTMPDNGAVTIVPTTTNQAIAAGYHNGLGKVVGDTHLISGNIKCGVTIFDVTGTHLPECVAKTGQTTSYDTGDDGAYQKGCLPIVAPSSGYSFGGYNRTSFTCSGGFMDNGNGTVTDNLTGLLWLKDASCSELAGTDANGRGDWTTALSAANSLANGTCGLSDGSSAGEWRLPNINELRSLFAPGLFAPYLPAGHPFTGVQSGIYWSSTTYAYSTPSAWGVSLDDGYVRNDVKTVTYYVWPVRGGQ